MEIIKGNTTTLGTVVQGKRINFAFDANKAKSCNLLLYDMVTDKKVYDIPLDDTYRTGNVFSVSIAGIDASKYKYNYEVDGEIITDLYASKIIGNDKWGIEKKVTYGGFDYQKFNWMQDKFPDIAPNDVIIYCMHTRGFTADASSKVKHKGTFKGIIEKISYLKKLGINQVELMPSYEFDEMLTYKKNKSINYWGYEEGFYFAPKSSYAASDDCIKEFKTLVRTLHKNNIELIMEFYFPKGVNPVSIIDVIKYWRFNYHIDGVHLTGEADILVNMLINNPVLTDMKIYYYNINTDSMVINNNNISDYDSQFGDSLKNNLNSNGVNLGHFIYYINRNYKDKSVVNYISSHNGFCLYDTFSYSKKHNEENGEYNTDGENNNFCNNYGAEGPTRKIEVNKLRITQIKNSFAMLLLSQGIPMIYAGDEFLNTQFGNNNAYCQDNQTGWVIWKKDKKSMEINKFVINLVKFRKSNKVFHQSANLINPAVSLQKLPTVSVHQDLAWYCQNDGYSKYAGIMYVFEDEYYYLAFNFEENEKSLALPTLPEYYKWNIIFSTQNNILEGQYTRNYDALPKTITVLKAVKYV